MGDHMKNTLLAATLGAAITLVGAPAVPAATDGPSLACNTVDDCEVVIDALYSDTKQLSAEVNDLRRIRDRAEKRIENKQETIARLRAKLRQR